MPTKEIKWTPEGGYTCPYCGTSNPAKSDNCVNCDKPFFTSKTSDSLFTTEEYRTYKEIVSARTRH